MGEVMIPFETLRDLLPSMVETLDTLHALVASPHPPPCIFVHSPQNERLTGQILSSVLGQQRSLFLDMVELFHPKLVYQVLLQKEFNEQFPSIDTLSQLGATLVSRQHDVKWWVWDKAERMQAVGKEGETQLGLNAGGDGWMGGILRLGAELSSPVSSILVSRLSWTQLRVLSASGGIEPICVNVDLISEEDEISVLTYCQFIKNQEADEHDKKLFRSLLKLLLQTFSSYIGNDLDELGWLAGKYWDRWREYVITGKASVDEEAKLMIFLKPQLMEQLSQFGGYKSGSKEESMSGQRNPLTKSLSTLAKYLLMASYFASYNPTKSDIVLFVRIDESVEGGLKRKKRRKTIKRKINEGDNSETGLKRRRKEPQHLLGPKAFSVERMLAIFQNILEEEEKQYWWKDTIEIQSQLSNLLSLRLLVPATVTSPFSTSSFHPLIDRLLEPGFKLICNVDLEMIEDITLSLGWRLSTLKEKIWGMNEDNVL